MSKHTPGPWVILDDEPEFNIVGPLVGREWMDNCVATVRAGARESTTFANARLIAAAPDMLLALKAALASLDDPTRGQAETRKLISIALARVER